MMSLPPGWRDWYKLGQRAVRAAEKKPEIHFSHNDSTPKLTVETVDTHIYFYADVDSDRCLAMVKEVREVNARLLTERLTRDIPKAVAPTPIWLHIQSEGGELFAALAASAQLVRIQTPIYSIVEGLCASAATLISMSCSRRYILPGGFMLLHQLSSAKWGTYEQFKDELHLQKMLMEELVSFYPQRSKVAEKQLRKMLKRDSWFNAQQCLELGLVDEIMSKGD